jgi:hypothetical protein
MCGEDIQQVGFDPLMIEVNWPWGEQVVHSHVGCFDKAVAAAHGYSLLHFLDR